jgi:hypothetical protein
MISRYSSFQEDRLLESAVSESMIYYTKEFKDSLYKLSLKSPIAKALIDVEYSDVKPDMTFIGMSDKEGYFSFTQINKAVRAAKKAAEEEIEQKHGLEKGSISEVLAKKIMDGSISQSDVNFIYDTEPYSLKSKARSEAKIAKLVNQIFPGKYSEKEVEEFTNTFKNLKKQENEFELVKGKDIVKWYNRETYSAESGDLGNSCMRYARCSSYFKIYTENPEVCSMLILKDAEGEKILGRSLVWKIDVSIEGVEFYMDRIYAIDDATKKLFQDYADDKGWLKRRTSSYGDYMDFMLGDTAYDDYRATVQLSKWKFDEYPYMDTFKALIVESGKLINSEDDDYSGRYIMTHTDGNYDDTSGKWSNWFDCRISEDDAVYSDPLDDWIYRSGAIRVTLGSRGRRGWYPDEYEELVHDQVRDEYIHEDDSTWSEYHDCYIYSDDAIEAITWIDSGYCGSESMDFQTSTVSDQSELVSPGRLAAAEYIGRYGEGYDIVKDILSYDSNTNKFIIDDCSIKTYKTEKGYLREEDAQALGLKGSGLRWTDKLAYFSAMDEGLKKELLAAYEILEKEADAIATGRQPLLKFGDEDQEGFMGDEKYIRTKGMLSHVYKKLRSEIKGWI